MRLEVRKAQVIEVKKARVLRASFRDGSLDGTP
jgi:hypothetical protein